MTRSGRLGTAAAALVLAGGLLAHTLDEEGLLPGVREAARVREYGERGAARPLLLLGCLLGAALAGAVVARLDRRRSGIRYAALLAVVVGGQATLFASFEVVARTAAGADVVEAFVEPGFVAGVVVQVAIAAAFVTLLLLGGVRLLARLAPPARPWHPDRTRPRTAAGESGVPARFAVAQRGRAPPYADALSPAR
jgi:hypothetical protein